MASSAGVLRFATIKGFRAWDRDGRTRYVAEARRLDGQPWEHIDGAKSYTYQGGAKAGNVGLSASSKLRNILPSPSLRVRQISLRHFIGFMKSCKPLLRR